jgi:O-antigen/teichoic acid export membrane protein
VSPSLRRGWLHLAGGAGVGRIAGFLSNLLLSRLLGPVDLGLFNLVATTVQTGDTLVRLGGDYALNYELGGEPGALETPRGRAMAQAFAQLCGVASVLLLIVLWLWLVPGKGLFPTGWHGWQRNWAVLLLLIMVGLEAISAAPWEVLLAGNSTARLSLRQGLFLPLRLGCAAAGASFAGLSGAMAGWSLAVLVQVAWLRESLGCLWQPLRLWPFLFQQCRKLLSRGLPFYAANMLSSLVFYPLLLRVAAGGGLAEIGYLRVGQIVQQLFAFLPATLVPVLFLQLRMQPTFEDQARRLEAPLRVIWLLLLEALLLYSAVDRALIESLFGSVFVGALEPTRLLLFTTLLECLSQLLVQPLLAAGLTHRYWLVQNGAAILAALLGWYCIPRYGLPAYLLVRLLYVLLPLLDFAIPVVQRLAEPLRLVPLAAATAVWFVVLMAEVVGAPIRFLVAPAGCTLAGAVLLVSRRDAFQAWALIRTRGQA